MKLQIKSTIVERVAKRSASDELGGESKKVMVDRHSDEKQASSTVSKSFDQSKFSTASNLG